MEPGFFIVGAPKSATTAMYTYLRKHPDIFMPTVKELHYFGTDLEFLPPGQNFRTVPRSQTELESYLDFFSEAHKRQTVGEASVWYLYSRRAAQEIQDHCPDAKIIVMLRNPVDLLYALHSQFLWEGNEDIEDFEAALAAEPDRKANRRLPETMHFRQGLFYRETVRFSEQLERYLQAFGREKVLVLTYEDFVKDSETAYFSVLDFLGVANTYAPQFERINANKRVRSRFLLRILTRPSNMIRRVAKLIPQKYRSKLVRYLRKANTRYVVRPPLERHLRQQLVSEFAQEIQSLGRLLNRDLSEWLA